MSARGGIDGDAEPGGAAADDQKVPDAAALAGAGEHVVALHGASQPRLRTTASCQRCLMALASAAAMAGS